MKVSGGIFEVTAGKQDWEMFNYLSKAYKKGIGTAC